MARGAGVRRAGAAPSGVCNGLSWSVLQVRVSPAVLCRSVPRPAASCCGVLRFGVCCRGALHCGALRCGVLCCLVLRHGGSPEVSLACVVVRSAGRCVAGWWLGDAVRCGWLAGSVLWGPGRAAQAVGLRRCPWGCPPWGPVPWSRVPWGSRPPEDVLYDIQPQPSQAWGQQRPARRPPTVTDATADTFMAERAAAEAQRTSSRHLSKPTPQAQGPPLTGPEGHQDPPAASLAPYQPSISANIQRMPRYCRRHESQPNPEAETVRAHPQVHIRSRPHSPRTPTEDYEEYPRPATDTSPHDPDTPTNTHSST